jgi:hypothetical protein
MNCHETYLWMLEAEEPTATPPVTITEHLRDCAKCRRRQKRVFRLLTAVQQLPPPPENPQIRAEVMSIVRQTTVLPAPRPVEPRPVRSRRWAWKTASVAAAAVMLIGLSGWLFSPFRTRPGPLPTQANDIRRVWNDDEDLRTRLLKRDLSLAEAKAPAEQLEALTGMAFDLKRESVRQAGRIDNTDLMRLAVLYEWVLNDGILPRARALSEQEQRQRLPALAKELRQTQAEAEQQAALQKPAAGAALRRVAHAAEEASVILEAPKLVLPARKAKVQEKPALLIDTLVVQGLRLADETDPLKHAEVCTDVEDSLVQTIMDASQSNRDGDEMLRLGAYLGAMARAVASNLARVDKQQLDAEHREVFRRVQQRKEDMMTELRRKAEEAPAPSRPALKQAVEASQDDTLDNTWRVSAKD